MAWNLQKFLETEWITVDDLEEGAAPVIVTIKDAYDHTFSSGNEGPVLEFMEVEKKLALNKTRATKVRELFGDRQEDVLGKQIGLYRTTQPFNGKPVATVAISAVTTKKSRLEVTRNANVADEADDVNFGDDAS